MREGRLDHGGDRSRTAELTKLGIRDPGMTITDGSGLARRTKVPADSMVKMLRVAAEQATSGAACGDHRTCR